MKEGLKKVPILTPEFNLRVTKDKVSSKNAATLMHW